MWNTLHSMDMEVIHNLLISFQCHRFLQKESKMARYSTEEFSSHQKAFMLLHNWNILSTYNWQLFLPFSKHPSTHSVQLHSNIRAISYSSMITGRRSGRYDDDYRRGLKNASLKLMHINYVWKIYCILFSLQNSFSVYLHIKLCNWIKMKRIKHEMLMMMITTTTECKHKKKK